MINLQASRANDPGSNPTTAPSRVAQLLDPCTGPTYRANISNFGSVTHQTIYKILQKEPTQRFSIAL